MRHLVLVGIGGMLGSVARYGVSVGLRNEATGRFPTATFVVNLAGCALIALLAGLDIRRGVLNADTRVFLFTGILGGFTTFSGFGLETITLLRSGYLAIAATYALLSVVLGLAIVWLGITLAS